MFSEDKRVGSTVQIPIKPIITHNRPNQKYDKNYDTKGKVERLKRLKNYDTDPFVIV